ncbi:MAG: DUF6273 domain-containing protein [Oscillospiraceae bacterium]|nr:DUF6273 domain-containing protein [Oscillospiraceae bacterium]
MKKVSKLCGILASTLLVISVGLCSALGSYAYAAPQIGTAGSVDDGINWNSYMDGNSYFFYGTYDHTSEDRNHVPEGVSRPIRFQVMGQDPGETNTVTLLSKYILDARSFAPNRNGSNDYVTSDIRAWLNSYNNTLDSVDYTASGFFTTAFSPAEALDRNIVPTYVSTSFFDFITGDELFGSSGASGIPTGSLATWPTTTPQKDKIYIPWGAGPGNSDQDVMYFSANTIRDDSAKIPADDYLRTRTDGGFNGGDAIIWQRTPSQYNASFVMDDQAQTGFNGSSNGWLYPDWTGFPWGVRPAFHLGTGSVIFISEVTDAPDALGATAPDGTATNDSEGVGIPDADTNYWQATEDNAVNYKLTVINDNLTLDSLKYNNSALSDGQAIAVNTGTASLSLTDGTASAGIYKLVYKVVGDVGGERTILDYGTGTKTNLQMDISQLAAGDYTVYVWAQKDNALNSNEASLPIWFSLKIASPGTTTSPEIPQTGDPAITLALIVIPFTAVAGGIIFISRKRKRDMKH